MLLKQFHSVNSVHLLHLITTIISSYLERYYISTFTCLTRKLHAFSANSFRQTGQGSSRSFEQVRVTHVCRRACAWLLKILEQEVQVQPTVRGLRHLSALVHTSVTRWITKGAGERLLCWFNVYHRSILICLGTTCKFSFQGRWYRNILLGRRKRIN